MNLGLEENKIRIVTDSLDKSRVLWYNKYMKTIRDSQRSKVYCAENVISGKRFDDIKELREYVKRICNSSFWKKLNGYPSVLVQDGRRRRKACAYDRYSISMPVWARSEAVTLHELAHTLVNFNKKPVADHGREFVKMFLKLVHHYMGKEEYILLRDSFKEHNVKYSTRKENL